MAFWNSPEPGSKDFLNAEGLGSDHAYRLLPVNLHRPGVLTYRPVIASVGNPLDVAGKEASLQVVISRMKLVLNHGPSYNGVPRTISRWLKHPLEGVDGDLSGILAKAELTGLTIHNEPVVLPAPVPVKLYFEVADLDVTTDAPKHPYGPCTGDIDSVSVAFPPNLLARL